MDAHSYSVANRKIAGLLKAREYVSKVGRAFCACCMIAIIASTTLSVFCRYVFFLPLNFSDPLSVFLLTWMVFVGSGLAIASGDHVFVDFFLSRFPAKLSKLMTMMSAAIISIFLIIITWYGYLFSWAMRDSSDPLVFGISMMVTYLSVPVGGTYSLVQLWLTTMIMLVSQKDDIPGKAQANAV